MLKNCSDNLIWLLKVVGKISGKEECRAFLKSTFEKIDIKEMKITDTEIIVSGDYGYEMSTYEAVTLPRGSNEENKFTLYSILIWHKETDGTWKEIRGTW